jgi:hypothetical protein
MGGIVKSIEKEAFLPKGEYERLATWPPHPPFEMNENVTGRQLLQLWLFLQQ